VTAENEVYKVTPDDPDMLNNIARPFKKSDICLQELTATDSLLNLLESGAGKFNILLVLGYLSHSLLDNCMQLAWRAQIYSIDPPEPVHLLHIIF
jgi:hypothetical protein